MTSLQRTAGRALEAATLAALPAAADTEDAIFSGADGLSGAEGRPDVRVHQSGASAAGRLPLLTQS